MGLPQLELKKAIWTYRIVVRATDPKFALLGLRIRQRHEVTPFLRTGHVEGLGARATGALNAGAMLDLAD